MPAPKINGFTVAYTAIGGIVLWSGITGTTLTQTFQDLLAGRKPTQNDEEIGTPTLGIANASSSNPENQTTATDTAIGAASAGIATVPGANTSIQNYGLAQMIAGTYGWAGGSQWDALTNIIARESGGNPNATNPASGAYGIAQALGHGTSATQGTVTNEYGGYGVPNGTAVGANSGNATDQLIWMMAYISETYGSPEAAWAHEQADGNY